MFQKTLVDRLAIQDRHHVAAVEILINEAVPGHGGAHHEIGLEKARNLCFGLRKVFPRAVFKRITDRADVEAFAEMMLVQYGGGVDVFLRVCTV